MVFDEDSESTLCCTYVVNPEANETVGISNGVLNDADVDDSISFTDPSQDIPIIQNSIELSEMNCTKSQVTPILLRLIC